MINFSHTKRNMIKIQFIFFGVIALSQSVTAGGFYKSHMFKKEYGPITKVSIDQENGDIFVGGTNLFAHLNQELQVIHMRVLGPVNDSQECKPRDNVCIGNVHSNFTETDDIVKVLVYNEHRQRLIVCGSAHQGMCFLYNPKTNLSEHWYERSIETAAYIGGKNTTVIVQSLKRNSDNYDEDIYFIGQSYDARNLKYFHTEFSKLAFRKSSEGFELFKYAIYANLSVCPNLKETFHIRFIYGFESGNYAYFLFVRSVDDKNGNRKYETKLAQICRDDQKFNSYIEFPLSCKANKKFNMASSAFFDRSGNVTDNKGTLYVTFGINNWRSGHLHDPLEGSALCKFEMSEINIKIIAVLRTCFVSYKGSTPDWRCETGNCTKPSGLSTVKDYCGHDQIKGVQAHSEFSFTQNNEFVINDELMTSVAVTQQGNESSDTIVIIGTDKGNILKLTKNDASFKAYAKYKFSEEKIEPDIVFDKNHTSAFVSSAEKVLKIDLRSCKIHRTCGECVTTIDPLGCGWCGDHCSTSDSCQGLWYHDTCPPFVHTVSPKSGPVSGNTALTITGQHFGSEMAERNVYLQNVNGNSSVLNCNITTGLDSRIICLTESSPKDGIYAVKVEVTDTTRQLYTGYDIQGVAEILQFNFSYFKPEIYNVEPLFGPKIGNTSMTITGKHLDIGSLLEVDTADFVCHVESVQYDTIICRTSRWLQIVTANKPVKQPDSPKCIGYGPVTVKIDGGLVWNQNDSDFCYMNNPEITNIYPHKTIKSGGFNLTIEGNHFDAVRNHEIVFKMYRERKDVERKCTSNVNGTRLTCPIPSYSGNISEDASVSSYIITKFDGMLDFSNRYKGNSNLTFYHDPVFNNLTEDIDVFLKSQTYSVKLKGKNLNLALTKDDYFITINHTRCNVDELGETFLICKLAVINFPNQYMRVEVRYGNIERTIGKIHFILKERANLSRQASSTTNAGLSGGVAAAVILSLVIFVIIIVKKCRPFKRKPLNRDVNGGMYANDRSISSIVPPSSLFDDREDSQRPRNDDSRYVRYGNAAEARQPLLAEGATGGANNKLSSVDHGTVVLLEKQNLLIDRNYLVLGENLGHGEFGCVYKGYLSRPGEKGETAVAVKTILKSGYGSNVEEFLNEALMMKDFNHPNVLKLIGISLEEGEFPLVILPFMKLGDLLTYIRNDENTPTVKDLVSFGIEIAQGMEYLSGIKYVHRDLAARNCMLDEHKTVKVADFGLSRDIYSKEYYSCDNKRKLPVKWMAPESLEKGTYTSKSDVWSYGVVLWELLTRGASPYPGVENWDIAMFIKMGRRLPRPEYCPEALYVTMTKCWEYNPGQRPTFKELLDEIMDIVLNKSQETRVKDIPVDLDKCTNYDYGDKHIPDWAAELQVNLTSAPPERQFSKTKFLTSQVSWTNDHPETVNIETPTDTRPNTQIQLDSATFDNTTNTVHFGNTGFHNKTMNGSVNYCNTMSSNNSISAPEEEMPSLSENTLLLNGSNSNGSLVEESNVLKDGVLADSDNSHSEKTIVV